MTNRDVVNAFLTAYQQHDFRAMHRCLDPDVEFHDLAFESIKGADVRAMWQWFCVRTATRKNPVDVPGFQIMRADGDTVVAEYWVRYEPGEGKHVNYIIHSEFTVRNGLICRQVDEPVISNLEFGRMAMGVPLCLLALTPFFKPAIRGKMRKKLDDFAGSAAASAVSA